jgi:hypothetical protein
VPLASGAAQAQATSTDVSISVFQSPIVTGIRILIIEFPPVANQLAYTSADARCGIAERTSTGWSGVTLLAACDVQLAQMTFASAANTCDGTIVGQMTGLGAGNVPVSATFAAPVNFLMPTSTRCHGSGGSCSVDTDCCNQSCSRFIGVCN